jgi:hypothetical protein
MRLKIERKNSDAIEAALAAVNGKATTFTITSYVDVADYAEQAEKKLEKSLLPKAERIGAKVFVTPDGPAAKAYKYSTKSTSLNIERGSTGWFLVGVASITVYPKETGRLKITITQAQRDTIQAKAVADYVVAKPAVEKAQALAETALT